MRKQNGKTNASTSTQPHPWSGFRDCSLLSTFKFKSTPIAHSPQEGGRCQVTSPALPPQHQHQQWLLCSFVGEGLQWWWWWWWYFSRRPKQLSLHRRCSVRGGSWHREEQLPGPSLERHIQALAKIQLLTSLRALEGCPQRAKA